MIEELKKFEREKYEKLRYEKEKEALEREEIRIPGIIYNEITSNEEGIPERKEERIQEEREEVNFMGVVQTKPKKTRNRRPNASERSLLEGLLESIRLKEEDREKIQEGIEEKYNEQEVRDIQIDPPLTQLDDRSPQASLYAQESKAEEEMGVLKKKVEFELDFAQQEDSQETLEIEDLLADDITKKKAARRARQKERKQHTKEKNEKKKAEEIIIESTIVEDQKEIAIVLPAKEIPDRLFNEYAKPEHLEFKEEMKKYTNLLDRPWIDSLSSLYRSMICYLREEINKAKKWKMKVTFASCCFLIWIGPNPPTTNHPPLAKGGDDDSKKFKRIINMGRIKKRVYNEGYMDLVKSKRAREIEEKYGKGLFGCSLPLVDINTCEEMKAYLNEDEDETPHVHVETEMHEEEIDTALGKFLVRQASEKRTFYWGRKIAAAEKMRCFTPLPLIIWSQSGLVSTEKALTCGFTKPELINIYETEEERTMRLNRQAREEVEDKLKYEANKEFKYCMKK